MTALASAPARRSAAQAPVDVTRVLEERVILLSPTFGSWEGRYKIPKELVNVTISGKNVDTSKRGTGVTTPYCVMLNDEWPVDSQGVSWKKRLNKVRSRKENVLRKYSVPFSMAGARIVPKNRGGEFFHELIGLTLGQLRQELREREDRNQGNSEAARTLRDRIQRAMNADPLATDTTPIFDEARETQSVAYEWASEASAFCRDLPNVMSQIQLNVDPNVWAALRPKVPADPHRMRAKFYSNILPVELPGAGTAMQSVTASDLARYQSVVREACAMATREAVEALVARPREELAEAIAGLQDVIDRSGRVSTKSFKPVYDAIAKIKAFEFAANSELLEQINSLERRMQSTVPSSLDQISAANSGFSAALKAVLNEVEDEERQASDIEDFGRERRGIVL